MSLTELEKQIYNAYLIASRTAKDKPFKLRRDFTKVDDNYINSGCYMGYAKNLLIVFEELNKSINDLSANLNTLQNYNNNIEIEISIFQNLQKQCNQIINN